MLTSCELSSGPFLLRTRSQFEIQTYVYRVYFDIVKLDCDSDKGQKLIKRLKGLHQTYKKCLRVVVVVVEVVLVSPEMT